MNTPVIEVIIPALDEEGSIGRVVRGFYNRGVARVIVADNGSSDATSDAATDAGAFVAWEPTRGYGRACLAGMAALSSADIVVFADGDGCDDPDDLHHITRPIAEGAADLCIGSRMSGISEAGALPAHSRFGNRLAAMLMRLLFGQRVTDMGPFRAIRRDVLESFGMSEPNFGWNVEMQAKAALGGWRVAEVPVRYRLRMSGRSKITGNLRKSLKAGYVIISTILRIRLTCRKHDSSAKPNGPTSADIR